MYAAVALTLIVAGCSLAVAVGGGLVDRKRPFTLLRVSGTQVGVLSRVVLLEAAVPLAGRHRGGGRDRLRDVGPGVRPARAGRHRDPAARAATTTRSWASAWPIAFGVITVTLPLLRRMTAPGNVRFE